VVNRRKLTALEAWRMLEFVSVAFVVFCKLVNRRPHAVVKEAQGTAPSTVRIFAERVFCWYISPEALRCGWHMRDSQVVRRLLKTIGLIVSGALISGCGGSDSCWGLLPGNHYTFVIKDGPRPGSLGKSCESSDLTVGTSVVFHVDSDAEDPVLECRVPRGTLVSDLGLTRVSGPGNATAAESNRGYALQVWEVVDRAGCHSTWSATAVGRRGEDAFGAYDRDDPPVLLYRMFIADPSDPDCEGMTYCSDAFAVEVHKGAEP